MCSNLLPADSVAVQEIWDLIALTNKGLMDAEDSARRIAEIFGLTFDEYRQQLGHGEVKDQKLLDYIKSLRGSYKTAMLSNVGVGSLARRFADGELERYFDIEIASGEIGYAKPEAPAYEITAERLEVRLEECVFIDDRQEYCDGAQAVGMEAILYKNYAQLRSELERILVQSAS
jgi:HAD superfamily hydrolase (TIGR01509 family)